MRGPDRVWNRDQSGFVKRVIAFRILDMVGREQNRKHANTWLVRRGWILFTNPKKTSPRATAHATERAGAISVGRQRVVSRNLDVFNGMKRDD